MCRQGVTYFNCRSMQNLRQLERLDIGNNKFTDLVRKSHPCMYNNDFVEQNY
jgi:hypothetical protein